VGEVLVIGGGIIGLAIALELKQQGVAVTVLSRDFKQAAAHAAAGMLAPQAEALPPSPFLDLCLRSRALYPSWTQHLEEQTGLSTGYWACGILQPWYEAAIHGKRSAEAEAEHWLDRTAIHQHQPGLSTAVGGGYWFPLDAQVDNRALAIALWQAAQAAGIDIQEGIPATSLKTQASRVTAVITSTGEWQADHYVLAGGAWSAEVLPVPVSPQKGQMLSVQVPSGEALSLQQVLFGSEIYMVPRRDGLIVLGATSEWVGFSPGNTPMGVNTLLAAAIRLYPAIADYPIQEFWWGFRPTTPDELPLLGSSPYNNLTLATGHHRNGILLAPITARLITDWIVQGQADPLLDYFHYARFQLKDGISGL
jgi:thiazole synthase